MVKTFLRVVSVFAVAVPAICNAQNYQKTAFGVKASINGIDVEVRFYSPEIVRVIKAPAGHIFSKESLSVIKNPQQTQISIRQQGDLLNLRSERLKVILNLKSGELAYAATRERNC